MGRITRVILAGINLPENRSTFDVDMVETKQLCIACNMEVVDTVVQQSMSMHPHTAFRKGKVEELMIMVKETDADAVVFHNNLSVGVATRLHEMCGVEVLDRTGLILHIFSERARSKKAQIQTEMARLQYDLPRVLQQDQEASEHARSSFHNRGSGEMRNALIEKKYKQRIALLRKELISIEKRHGMDNHRRAKTLLKRVALVGYTNSGKSSLLNVFINNYQNEGTQVQSEDMLFATLDTSVRRIQIQKKCFYMYDTVGFVSSLPKTLLDAFHSTLAVCKEADLLVMVIDASDAQWEYKVQATLDALHAIGADDIPVIRVFNKIDLVNDTELFSGYMTTSTVTMEGIDALGERILNTLYPEEEKGVYVLPYDKIGLLEEYKQVLGYTLMENTEIGMRLTLSGEHTYLRVFEKYKEEEVKNEDSLAKVE